MILIDGPCMPTLLKILFFAFLFAAVLMLVAGLYSQDTLLIGVAVLFALMAWLVGMEAKKQLNDPFRK